MPRAVLGEIEWARFRARLMINVRFENSTGRVVALALVPGAWSGALSSVAVLLYLRVTWKGGSGGFVFGTPPAGLIESIFILLAGAEGAVGGILASPLLDRTAATQAAEASRRPRTRDSFTGGSGLGARVRVAGADRVLCALAVFRCIVCHYLPAGGRQDTEHSEPGALHALRLQPDRQCLR